MSTNLIQNFISNRSAAASQPKQQTIEAPKKPKPHFDIQRELNNRTFIKPLNAKGKLVRENVFNAPAIMLRDSIYDVKAINHAIKGEANDHELGKLNDVGLKLGGLGIAYYLFTKKTTPMTKGMEFVGLASFLASMAIWPKLAIQLPAKLIHGVNVQQQYEDSFGRKKPLYQDPQFIPWDLYSDKEIQKIGDRLGVPKNIQNRRDFIQEKMKKIALQNNTLWMLTAGFATPVMSALICNQAEPYLSKYLNNRQNKKADGILTHLDQYSQKYKDNKISKGIEALLSANAGKPVDKNLQTSITDTLTHGMDLVTAESFKRDLGNIFDSKHFVVDNKSAETISKSLAKIFEGKDFDDNFLKAVIPSGEDISKLLEDKHTLNVNVDRNGVRDITDSILFDIEKRVKEFNKTVGPDDQEDIRYVKDLIKNTTKNEHPIEKVLLSRKSLLLTPEIQSKLKNVAGYIDDFRAKNAALDEYALKKVGSAPETVIANYWNDISKDMLKTLDITPKEIDKVKFDRSLMGNLLREKIEHIVANKESYDRVMKTLVEKVAFLNSEIKPSDMASDLLRKADNKVKTAYDNIVDTKFNEFANSLRASGFSETADAIVGINPGDNVGTYKNIQKTFVSDRLLGVKSSFDRLINTLDFFRKVATKTGITASHGRQEPREVMEELIELCKITLLEGHSSDHATKFYMKRNQHPANDYSEIEVKDGKVVNKYFGKTKDVKDIPGDKYFYQNAMSLMYSGEMHPDTAAILKNSIVNDEVLNYRDLILNKLGGDRYFDKPRHLISHPNRSGSDIKFLLTGIAPDELFFKAGQQRYNTNKWFKMFATFGGALLGVTVLAQFFFGKMKAPDGTKGSQK